MAILYINFLYFPIIGSSGNGQNEYTNRCIYILNTYGILLHNNIWNRKNIKCYMVDYFNYSTDGGVLCSRQEEKG